MAGGRPTKMTEITLKKIEEAFLMGCSDLEACLYADISHTTLYNYQDKNPEFIARKERLKENPVLQARSSVLNGFSDDPKLAMDFLKNKRSDEFSTKSKLDNKNEQIGDINTKTEITITHVKA